MRTASSLALFVLLGTSLALVPAAEAQEPNPIPMRSEFRTVYPDPGQAQADLQKAMELAGQQHKRILVNFGNNQGPECQVLAEFFENYINRRQIEEHFLVVPVNVGKDLDKNRDMAERFGVSISGGVPVLVVLDPSGQVLARDEDFRLAHNMSANDLTVFLNKWRELAGGGQPQ